MAVINRGILGAFSGSVGNIVGSSWKGIGVMKSKPLSVANPQTAAQVSVRDDFSAVSKLASDCLVYAVKPLWDRFAQKQSGYNAFIQKNITAVNDGIWNTLGNFALSMGNLTPTAAPTVLADRSANTIVLTWVNNNGSGSALSTDEAYAIGVNTGKNTWAIGITGRVRSSLTMTIPMPDDWETGDAIAFFLSFRRVDGTKVSTSVIVEGDIQA